MARRTTVAKMKAKRKKAKTPKRPGSVRAPEHPVETASASVAEPLVAGGDSVDKLAAWLLQQADLSGV